MTDDSAKDAESANFAESADLYDTPTLPRLCFRVKVRLSVRLVVTWPPSHAPFGPRPLLMPVAD